MEKKEKKQKKEMSTLTAGLLCLLIGLVALIFGGDLVWVLLGLIRIPVPIIGGILAVLGVIVTISGIKEKISKKKNSNAQ